MKRLYYASGSVLTGDSMADAIVAYAAALAMRETSDTIDIPIAMGDGETGRAQLLIGPASQFVVVPEPGRGPDPVDQETFDELARKTLLLSSPHPQAVDQASTTYYADGNEYTDAFDED